MPILGICNLCFLTCRYIKHIKWDWVIDLDIKGLFDNLDHQLLMRAVKKHTKEKWMLMYIERWLKAPVEKEDGRGKRESKARHKEE